MNVNLLSPSPLAFRTPQTAEFLRGRVGRKAQNVLFPTASTVTVSNLNATSHVITNYASFLTISGGPSAPVINTTNFDWVAGVPVMTDWAYPSYLTVSNSVPTSQYGFGLTCAEFVVNATQMEIGILAKGFGTFVEVDGTMVLATTGGASQTAQAGAAGSITFYASANATTNYYVGQYVYIVSGTGAGQRRRVTAYNGTTKVATVDSNWSVTPDNTSIYAVDKSPVLMMSTPADGNSYYPLFTFSGERTSHTVRVWSGNPLRGVYTDSSGTVSRPAQRQEPTLFVIGDSFGEGTGAAEAATNYAALLTKALGMRLQSCCAGATGVTTYATSKTTYKERTCPPVNAWIPNLGGATGGTYTLTQGAVTTGALNYNANSAAIQTALDTAFGAGLWRVAAKNTSGGSSVILLGLGANAGVTTALTINSSLTGTSQAPAVAQYLGDIAPLVPKDGFGKPLPFYILVQNSINDVNNYATLAAAAQDLYASLQAKFPTATIIACGTPMTVGPATGNYLLAEAALETVASTLPAINGKSAFIPLFDKTTGVGYLNGTTNVTTASGAAGINTDMCVMNDGVHPSQWGHMYIADTLINAISGMLQL